MNKKLVIIVVSLLMIVTFVDVAILGSEIDIDSKAIDLDMDSLYYQSKIFNNMISEITFSQLDWYYQGKAHTLDSLWGRIDIIAEPDSSFWYMNVVADAGIKEAWIVQNYPIFPEEYSVPDDQVIFFNIEDLGYKEGMSLRDINAIITLDSSPQQTQPQGEFYLFFVNDSIRDAWGHTLEVPETVGKPNGHKADGEVEDAIKHKNVPAVQEDTLNCITGSYARSIKWLDNEYDLVNLPAATTAQDVYDDLVGLGIGHGNEGHDEGQMLEDKADYLQGLDDRAVTKFVDFSYLGDVAGQSNPDGVPEESPENLADWLEEELKTEDVEMCYDSHCITLTGMYKQGGKTFLEYRDDENQSDTLVGDAGEKEGELTKVGDEWRFNGFKVDYVVSESINEAPNAPEIDGPTSGKPDEVYDYLFSTVDIDGDQVYYHIKWGDGNLEEWIGPYDSGESFSLNHTWIEKGTYTITAKAKDIYGAEGPEGTLDVSIPKIKGFPKNTNKGQFEAELGRRGNHRPFLFLNGSYHTRNRYIVVKGTAQVGIHLGRYNGIFNGNRFIIRTIIENRIFTVYGRCRYDNRYQTFTGIWMGRGIPLRGWITGTFTPIR